ncbi:MAG TPA: hypothetical protein VLJ79_12965, partial [Candidatus Binatia bacterium]|nr:hypothetical protein [Candidatus Binatia bacterium]
MKLFSVAFALVSVFLATSAMAVSVGFYAGTFDPPTQSQIRMIRCALGDILHKECEEMGKQISRLVVLVNNDSEKDTLASTREQILMLRRALQNHSDRVEIVAATTAQAEEKKRDLVEDKNIDQLFQIVSADAYKELRSSPAGEDPKLAWLTFPLEEGGSFKGPATDRRSAGVGATEVIEKLGLYQEISADLADLQRS